MAERPSRKVGSRSQPGEEATKSKLSRRLTRIPPQTEALRRAIEQFGAEFDLDAWTSAFESSDPDAINRVGAAVNDYNAVVNNVVELVRAGVKAVGLEPTEGDWPQHSFRAYVETVVIDGGLSTGQRDRMMTLNQMRNRLQHDSPNVTAAEAHAEIVALLSGIRGFLKSYLAWLGRRGISF